MKVYGTRGPHELVKGVVRHFLEALAFTGNEHWVVSPWISDVRLPVGELGHFASVLGGHHEEITFSNLMKLVAERHTLHVITKPPEELFDLRVFSLLSSKLDQYERVKTTHEAEGPNILKMVASTLPLEIDELIRGLRTHEATYRFSQTLHNHGAVVRYLSRLHAKVIWGPSSAFIGSANFTNGGFYNNEELVLEVSERRAHRGIRDQVQAMAQRAKPYTEYDLSAALRRNGYHDEIEFLSIADSPLFDDYPDIKRLVNELGYLVR